MNPNLAAIKKKISKNNRYETRIAQLKALPEPIDVTDIDRVVHEAVRNVAAGKDSFVIYGEPQSGKTELMIALTAKLLDSGTRIVIVLLNDSLQLLNQNLFRFHDSRLIPSPKRFSEILKEKIGDHHWIIFCKKNAKDLGKLVAKLKGVKTRRVILDDEADFATPNGKINAGTRTKINQLTDRLRNRRTTYIGVTATPARLSLNRTHNNIPGAWIEYPPHKQYTGQDHFFPVPFGNSPLPYRLTLLWTPPTPDDLRAALFSYMVNVAHLNTVATKGGQGAYSILIHTSGKKSAHEDDRREVAAIFAAVRASRHRKHKQYLNELYSLAEARYPGLGDDLLAYILGKLDHHTVIVMNSDSQAAAANNELATDPRTTFTVVIGGNIVSRGVTFKNLLSMFFTRDVAYKLQQDTYIQRARMFGARLKYLSYFELTIPVQLYQDWHRCFFFHRLSLQSVKANKDSPVWYDGNRVAVAARASIDKATVQIRSGEMGFALFDWGKNEPRIKSIIRGAKDSFEAVDQLAALLGAAALPQFLVNLIKQYPVAGSPEAIAVHDPKSVDGYKDVPGVMDKRQIYRQKGFIGAPQMEKNKFPKAVHHISIMYNKWGRGRVMFRYKGDIRFLEPGRTRQYSP